MKFQAKSIFGLIGMLLFTACNPSQPTTKSDKDAPKRPSEAPAADAVTPANELVIYSGRSQVLVQPLFDAFTAETGIKVTVRYDKSTQNLATRLAAEGEKSKADLFFAQDSGYLGALAKSGLLAKLPEPVLNNVASYYRDSNGLWVGTSGRARVLVYDPKKVSEKDLPDSLQALTNPKWKGLVGWAPSNASFQAHVSALRHIWGEKTTREWLTSMQSLNPKVYPKNSPQVKAVSNGEIVIGWVNHYYLHKLRAANPDLQAANYSFRTAKDAGNVMMLSGIAITKSSKNKANAEKLISYLLRPETQKVFAEKLYEYPTNAQTKPSNALPPLDQKIVTVEQEKLADVEGTLTLLRDLKIL